MEGIFLLKADFSFGNKEVGSCLLRKRALGSQAASWLQYLGEVATSSAGFQYEFCKVSHYVENSDLGGGRKKMYFVYLWKLPAI